MAYVRLGPDSDICLQAITVERTNFVRCWGCLFRPEWDEFPSFTSKAEVETHVKAHIDAGHKVPDWVLVYINMDNWIT